MLFILRIDVCFGLLKFLQVYKVSQRRREESVFSSVWKNAIFPAAIATPLMLLRAVIVPEWMI
jgi:hypothetical protein